MFEIKTICLDIKNVVIQNEDKNINIKGLEFLSSVYIFADQDMLSQVFYNLADNAVKFTDKGGEISVSMSADEDNITVVIRNTGKGIAQEDINHVFERFYRVDKGRSRKAGGTGLGLSIVKHAVIFHGGKITAVNRQEGGLEYQFSLARRAKVQH